VDGLCAFYKWRGRYREGIEVCSRAMQGLSAPGDVPLRGSFHQSSAPASVLAVDRLRLLSRLLAWQGVFHWQMGQAKLADERLRESQRLWEGHALEDRKSWPEVAFALWRRGRMMFDRDRVQAGPCYAASLEFFRALGDRWAAANVLEDLAWLARYQGGFEEARQMGEESLFYRQALGDQRGISRSLGQLSTIAYRQGRLEEAESQIRESSAMAMVWSQGADLADTLSSSGWILTMLGYYQEGEARLAQSVAIWKDLGVRRMVDYIGASCAFATLHQNSDAEVRPLLQAGLDASRQLGDLSRSAFYLRLLGWAALAQEAYAEAQAVLLASRALYEELGDRDQAGEALALSAYAARGLGQHTRARHIVGEALQLAFSMQVFLPAVLALPALALLLADEGRPGPAVEAYALASRCRLVADSRWFEKVAGGPICLAAGSLWPDSLAVIKPGGHDGNLLDAVATSFSELEWPSGWTEQGWPLPLQHVDAAGHALPPGP
jgi:tetratricopeptide (TPR) repeat protein